MAIITEVKTMMARNRTSRSSHQNVQHDHHQDDHQHHHYRPLTRTLRREDREGRRLVFDVSRGDPGDTLCDIVFNIFK